MTVVKRRGPYFYVNGKYVGAVKPYQGHLMYITERASTVHFFRKYGGYGISSAILAALPKALAKGIVMREKRKDGSEDIISGLQWWFDHGIKVQEEGYDEQVVLPLSKIKELTEEKLSDTKQTRLKNEK